MPDPTPIARTPDEALTVLQVETPLGAKDDRYVDLSPARGPMIRKRMAKILRAKPKGTWCRFLFVSHRGAGKSTELSRLAGEIRDRYFPIYLEANVEMEPSTIELEDLLLVLATVVEARMRKEGAPLDPKLLDEISGWFASVVKETEVGQTYSAELAAEGQAGVDIPYFARLMSRFTALFRVSSEHRTSVKHELRKYTGQLVDRVSRLLAAANERLVPAKLELLVIIDNLDRYDPEVIDKLLLSNGEAIARIACNFVFTPPIANIYQIGQLQGGNPEDFYSVQIMPSVKLRERTDGYEVVGGLGYELLTEVLRRRIDLDALIPDEELRKALIRASGGAVRELVQLTLSAMLETDGDRLDRPSVERAIRAHRSLMADRIAQNTGWAETLARIGANKLPTADAACAKVLFHRLAFLYNGEGWYDIHPLVAEIELVRDASRAGA